MTEKKLFNRYFILVWIAALAINLCQNILNNSVSLFITSLGMTTGFAGLLGIPYAVLAILMRFLGGAWVDRRSRRSLLAVGCFGFGVTALLFGFLPAAGLLIVFRGLHGFFFSAGQLACSTINVDVTPPDRARLGIGIFWVAPAIALGSAGYMVTALTKGGSFAPLFTACALCAGLAGVLALLCSYEKKNPVTGGGTDTSALAVRGWLRFFEPSAMRPAILMFLMAISMSGVSLYILLFAQEEGYANAGLTLVFATFGMAVGNLSSDRLQEKIGANGALLLVFAVSAAGYAVMALWHNMTTYLIGGTVYGLVQGICMPVLYYLAVNKMPAHRRGVAGGTVYCMLDLGVGVGTLLWGLVIQFFSFSACFLAAAAVLVIAGILTAAFYPMRNRAG